MAGPTPSSRAPRTRASSSTMASPLKVSQEWPLRAPSAPHVSSEATGTPPEESTRTTPVTEIPNSPSHKSKSSIASALRRFVCRSRIMEPFMIERAAREPVALPPPIHVFYPEMKQVEAVNPNTVEKVSRRVNAEENQPRGDMFDFHWSRKEINAMRRKQRAHLCRQRHSPHAPVQVMSQLLSRVLSDTDMQHLEQTNSSLSNSATSTKKCRAANAVAGLCTRGVPQGEYIKGVFHYRMDVLQKRIGAIPTGVVVPAVVQASVTLDQLSEVSCEENPPKPKKGELKSHKKIWSTTVSTVTFPHPGRPFGFQDLAQNPLLLTAEQRADLRSALLHERTLSEDVYGDPVSYL